MTDCGIEIGGRILNMAKIRIKILYIVADLEYAQTPQIPMQTYQQ